MILVIDNYDSFTYNLVQYLGQLNPEVEVVRNDEITSDEVLQKCPDYLILSPGPGTPDEAGVCLDLLQSGVAGKIPTLGVCLGHQAIAQNYGGKVIRAPEIVHGKTSPMHHEDKGVFRDIENPFEATRYHSLCVEASSLPDILRVTAHTADGMIMGLEHKTLPIQGVQFHPESVLTEDGLKLLSNFLEMYSPKE